MRVGVDIDDVLFPFSANIHAYCETAGITNGQTITQWEFHNDYGISRGELWDTITRAYSEGILLRAPYSGVSYDLGRLRAAGHTVHLATARGFEPGMAERVQADTWKWVRYWGVPYDTLTFTRDKRTVLCDMFLDDSVANVEALRSAGVDALLRDQPHNRESDLPRVRDLREFVDGVLMGVSE